MKRFAGSIQIDRESRAICKFRSDPQAHETWELGLAFTLFALRQLSNLSGRKEADLIAHACKQSTAECTTRNFAATTDSIRAAPRNRSFEFSLSTNGLDRFQFDSAAKGFGIFAKGVGSAAISAVAQLRVQLISESGDREAASELIDQAAREVGSLYFAGKITLTNHSSLARQILQALSDNDSDDDEFLNELLTDLGYSHAEARDMVEQLDNSAPDDVALLQELQRVDVDVFGEPGLHITEYLDPLSPRRAQVVAGYNQGATFMAAMPTHELWGLFKVLAPLSTGAPEETQRAALKLLSTAAFCEINRREQLSIISRELRLRKALIRLRQLSGSENPGIDWLGLIQYMSGIALEAPGD